MRAQNAARELRSPIPSSSSRSGGNTKSSHLCQWGILRNTFFVCVAAATLFACIISVTLTLYTIDNHGDDNAITVEASAIQNWTMHNETGSHT